jgi:hypothetical protein
MTPSALAVEQPLLLTAAQAGALLGVSEWTFRRMIRDGQIPPSVEHPLTYGQSRNRRYVRKHLEAFLNDAETDQFAGRGTAT